MSSPIGSTGSGSASVAAQQYAQQLAALQAQYAGAGDTAVTAAASDATTAQALPSIAAGQQAGVRGFGGHHHHGGETRFERGGQDGGMRGASGSGRSGGYGAWGQYGGGSSSGAVEGVRGFGRGGERPGLHRSEGGGGFGRAQADPQAFAEALLQRFDTDGDSSISEAELVAGIQDAQAGTPAGAATGVTEGDPEATTTLDGTDGTDGTDETTSTAPSSLPDGSLETAVADDPSIAAATDETAATATATPSAMAMDESGVVSDPSLQYVDAASVYAALANGSADDETNAQVAA